MAGVESPKNWGVGGAKETHKSMTIENQGWDRGLGLEGLPDALGFWLLVGAVRQASAIPLSQP